MRRPFAAIFGILLLLRHITKRVYGYGRLFTDFAPAVALPFLAFTFLNCGFMYDFPEILLALACLALLMNRWWIPYYIAFVLACMDKETGVFTVIYFVAFHISQMPRKQLAAHCALHVLLGCATVLVIRAAFADNPGVSAERGFDPGSGSNKWRTARGYAQSLRCAVTAECWAPPGARSGLAEGPRHEWRGCSCSVAAATAQTRLTRQTWRAA